MWKTEMVLVAPELGNDVGINVTVYHLGLLGLSITIQHKEDPLWREKDDPRSTKYREWKQKQEKR